MPTEDEREQQTSVSNGQKPVSTGKSPLIDPPKGSKLPQDLGPGDPKRKRKHYRHKDLPLFNREQVSAALKTYDRRPFLDLLTTWLENAPDPEAILDFADAHPDRWANALASIAKIGGFTEKKEIDIDVNLNIRSLSDSQLEDRLAQLKSKLIDMEAEDVTETEGNPAGDET